MKIQKLELGRRIDNDSVHFSAMVGSSMETAYPVTGTLNIRTNVAHLDTASQTLQDDQFENFDICEAIENRGQRTPEQKRKAALAGMRMACSAITNAFPVS